MISGFYLQKNIEKREYFPKKMENTLFILSKEIAIVSTV